MNGERPITDEFGLRVARQLDRAAADLSDRTLQRLSAARALAIGRVRDERPLHTLAPAPVTATSGGTVTGSPLRTGFAFALTALVLALGLFTINEWQQSARVAELVEIDAQILSDDLPIDAAADPGFVHFVSHER